MVLATNIMPSPSMANGSSRSGTRIIHLLDIASIEDKREDERGAGERINCRNLGLRNRDGREWRSSVGQGRPFNSRGDDLWQ